jgi:5-methylcytosine-specific restriction endonuclease McrBC regulatory subunit McrC
VITVPERGETVIDRATWLTLADDPEFWRLVDQKVVSVRQLTSGEFSLHGGAYVGRAQTRAGVLEITEKIEGALAALLTFAGFDAFRVERTPSPATDLGSLLVLLVRQFHEEVSEYVSRGRQRRYTRRREASSLVGGRIDMTQTIALRARGLGHLIAFDRNVLTRATLQNRVIYAALREVESLRGVLSIPAKDVARGRVLIQFFNDVRDRQLLFGRRESLVELSHQALARANESDRSMLSLASIVLSHQSFEQARPREEVTPRAWFLNLETLFEDAVRSSLRRQIGRAKVKKGTGEFIPIFPASAAPYDADPDLVVNPSAITLVGDVKYKDWAPDALIDRGDLYQLLVHTSAYGARRAFLVYPSERFEVLELGAAVTGADVFAFGFAVTDLAESSKAFIEYMSTRIPTTAVAA